MFILNSLIAVCDGLDRMPRAIRDAVTHVHPELKEQVLGPKKREAALPNPIVWIGTRGQLITFLQHLGHHYDLIDTDGLWIRESNHFVNNDGIQFSLVLERQSIRETLANKNSPKAKMPIRWKSTSRLLSYLFYKLVDEARVVHVASCWVQVASTFINRQGQAFNSRSLLKYGSGARIGDFTPNGSENIDAIVKKLISQSGDPQ